MEPHGCQWLYQRHVNNDEAQSYLMLVRNWRSDENHLKTAHDTGTGHAHIHTHTPEGIVQTGPNMCSVTLRFFLRDVRRQQVLSENNRCNLAQNPGQRLHSILKRKLLMRVNCLRAACVSSVSKCQVISRWGYRESNFGEKILRSLALSCHFSCESHLRHVSWMPKCGVKVHVAFKIPLLAGQDSI